MHCISKRFCSPRAHDNALVAGLIPETEEFRSDAPQIFRAVPLASPLELR